MKHQPLTKQRSPWVGDVTNAVDFGNGYIGRVFRRAVGDGRLTAIVCEEPAGWHLSISYAASNGEHTRYPTWDEQVHAVRELLPTDLTYAMILPPDGEEYVSVHMTTFHWHEHPARGEG